MDKIDYRKTYKTLYRPSAKQVSEIDMPVWQYLMIDGRGDPNTESSFSEAIEALYSVSYTLKFAIKKDVEKPLDYAVMPLEALWWADDWDAFLRNERDQWQWTAMIMQPEVVTAQRVAQAIETVSAKKSLPALPRLRFETLAEGRCAQIMHLGPFDNEGPTIERVHAHIAAAGRERSGKHHEIYLSDMRRAKPENWKTIIRQPMR